jgi:glycosyltransferase involved in cell wall biosynthesis
MRILFSMTNLDLGGAQMFVMRLAEEMLRRGHEVYIFNHQPEWSNKEFQKSFSKKLKIISYADNFPPYFVWKINGLIHRFNTEYNFRNRFDEHKYRKTIEKYKFDIVHSQMFTSDRLIARITVEKGIPFVITTHGEYELNLNEGKMNFEAQARKCLDLAEMIVYTAEKNIEAIRSLVPENKPVRKISVGFDGTAIPKFKVSRESLGIAKDDFVIGMVARGIAEKGWNEAISMFHLIQHKYKGPRKVHFVLIGNGEELRELFDSKKTENMHLLQNFKNTMEYFSWVGEFDMGILLSYFKGESVPNSIIEYLYHGLPVLATPMGDIPEMISSPGGMAGEIVPLKSGKADFTQAADVIMKWLDQPEYFSQLIGNTAAAFQKFDMKNIASEYVAVYEEAINRFKSKITRTAD